MVEGRGCSGSREGISGEGRTVVREGKGGKVWLIDRKDIVGLGIVVGCRRIRARSSVFRGRSGRLRGVAGNGSGRGGRIEVGKLIVDIKARRGVGVLLLLLLGIVESAEGVLGLAGIAEGISEEGASGVDRIWVKGTGSRVRLKMTEGLLLLLLLLGLLATSGLGGASVEMEALLANFWVRRVVDEGHEDSWSGRCGWREERGSRGRIQD
jgi:hypothetical protein